MTNGVGPVDGGQVWLVNCLNATLDANPQVRTAAEEALKQASVHPGYGVALTKAIINTELHFGLRQLAAVLLKQYVKQHWQKDEKNFVEPEVSPEDKAAIKELLPAALEDPHGKIRTAVGMAIASIANWDWPEEWPGLMGYLLSLINDRTDINKVHGALRCLALFAGDLDDVQLPPLVPVLFPALFAIVTSKDAYDSSLRRRALIILHSCISTLGVMSGVYQQQTKELMSPMLKSWMEQFALILTSPVPSEDADDWGLRMETFKVLMRIVENFPKLAAAEFPEILAPLWQTFVSGLKVYEQACVKGVEESFSGMADSDGTDQSLESFAIQLFEFLLTAVSSPRFSKIVRKSVGELVYYTVGYMQMTEEQVQTWSSDPNQYVADEDDVTYSCRVSGILLLEELVTVFEMDGLRLIVEAVQQRLIEASQAKALGRTDWWKLREAAILAIGTVANSLHEMANTVHEAKAVSLSFNFEPFLDSILAEDLGAAGVQECPFLHGRALWAAAKFSTAIDKPRSEKFFYAAINGLGDGMPAPIKVGACRALAQLFEHVNVSSLRTHLGPVYAALAKLLQEAAIKADDQAAAAAEPVISPLLLNTWANNVSDPFISCDAFDTLETLKKVPGCAQPLALRALPVLASILARPQHQPQQQPQDLVNGALDLLAMLLKKAPLEVVKAAHDASFKSVISIVLQSDDTSELQNGTECLAAFVREGGEALLGWGGDADQTMRMLLDSVARLLNPEQDSSSALFVGNLVTTLITQLSVRTAPHIRDLIAALVIRMQSTSVAVLKSKLLIVFARLVHMASPNVGQLIDLLATIPAKEHENALAYVMSEWVMHQVEIQGSYQIKVSTTALALLLASGHPQLSQIYVQGHIIKSNASGIVTRSRAKVSPDQWTRVPLQAKLLALLADSLVEAQEQGPTSALDNDEEWEDADEDEDDDKDDDENAAAMDVKSDKGPSSVFKELSGYEHLLTDEVEEGDYEEDPCAASDPLNKINLAVYVSGFIKQLWERDGASFQQLCQTLTDSEKGVVQSVLSR
uniref:Importin N-terminal domain-containing protein n=1 Tax=Physcomitrium patens TaxID=3218 RepID=A0A7I4DD79_PHYPA